MTETLLKIWNIILTSNLFNFVLMLVILGWIINKFNLADVLENGRQKIEDRLILARASKEKSIKTLFEVQEKDKEIDKKVYETINHSVQNAVIVGEKLVSDAKIQAEGIEKSTQKSIETNIEKLRMNVTAETAESALNIAKEYIVNEFKKNRDLHIRYINESIEALKEIEL